MANVIPPTVPSRIFEALRTSAQPLDDDELARRLNVRPQTITQACRALEIGGRTHRRVGPMGKIVNEVRPIAESADRTSKQERWPAGWRALDHDPTAVRKARLKRDWSQRRLAEEVGVSPSHISEIESGRRNANPSLLRRLAQALRCSISSLEHRKAVENPIGGRLRFTLAEFAEMTGLPIDFLRELCRVYLADKPRKP